MWNTLENMILPDVWESFHMNLHMALVDYVSYSFFAYWGMLFIAWVIRQIWLFFNPSLVEQYKQAQIAYEKSIKVHKEGRAENSQPVSEAEKSKAEKSNASEAEKSQAVSEIEKSKDYQGKVSQMLPMIKEMEKKGILDVDQASSSGGGTDEGVRKRKKSLTDAKATADNIGTADDIGKNVGENVRNNMGKLTKEGNAVSMNTANSTGDTGDSKKDDNSSNSSSKTDTNKKDSSSKTDTKPPPVLPRPPVPPMMINHRIQYWHNIFLVVQSIGLIIMCFLLNIQVGSTDQKLRELREDQNLAELKDFKRPWINHLLQPEVEARLMAPIFKLTITCFLLNKLYESVDTIILVLNGKDLLLLHCWHHATTFFGFFQGFFQSACLWIGVLNSFIHVIMYLYYAKVAFIFPFTKWITSLQIFHLFGGTALAMYTILYKPETKKGGSLYTVTPSSDDRLLHNLHYTVSAITPTSPSKIIDTFVPIILKPSVESFLEVWNREIGGYTTYTSVGAIGESKTPVFLPVQIESKRPISYYNLSINVNRLAMINGFILFSYFFLFLAFFSKKYHKNGNIWKMFKIPTIIPNTISMCLPQVFVEYLKKQGLL